MTPVETLVFDFLTEKAAGHPAFAAAEIYDNPFRDVGDDIIEGIWVGFARGDFDQIKAGENVISNAGLTVSIRAFIGDKDTSNRQAELQKVTDIASAITGWFFADHTMAARTCRARVLGFDNGSEPIDGQDYAGANLFLGVHIRGGVSNQELLARAQGRNL